MLVPSAILKAGATEVEKLSREILGVPDSGTDAVNALKQYYALDRFPPPTEQRRLVREFATKLMTTGVKPGELRKVVTDGLSVYNRPRGTAQNAPEWKAFMARMSLLPIMLSELKTEKDPEQARTLSRALLFVGTNDCINGANALAMFFANPKGDDVRRSAQLSDEAMASLKDMFESAAAERSTAMKQLIANSRALDRMIKAESNADEWAASSVAFLEALDAGVAPNPVNLSVQLDLLTHAWQAKCLAAATGHDDFIAKLKASLGKIRNRTNCEITLRWVTDAETQPGPIPKRPYHVIIDDPNVLKRGKPE